MFGDCFYKSNNTGEYNAAYRKQRLGDRSQLIAKCWSSTMENGLKLLNFWTVQKPFVLQGTGLGEVQGSSCSQVKAT